MGVTESTQGAENTSTIEIERNVLNGSQLEPNKWLEKDTREITQNEWERNARIFQ